MDNEERQFESEMSSQERQIDALLGDALAVPTPEGFADRIAIASQDQLAQACDQVLEQQLDGAFATSVPEGLATRVYAASIHDLHNEQPVVIARIDRRVVWREVALAASILFAVFIAIRFGPEQQNELSPQPYIASNAVLSIEDEELLLEDLNLSEYAYLTDTRELAFADVAIGLENLRNDIELWQYGLLTD
jgi:hypothetical protein